ncbi:MAG: hypothetical protein ACLRMN_13220 [Mediterraneibacter gnavus]
MQILCVVVLYLQNELFKKSAMRQERLVSDLLWRQQKEHYRIAKENIDIINRKCHDLKHQISALRDMCTKEERRNILKKSRIRSRFTKPWSRPAMMFWIRS